jgi:altronate hydrolase
MEKYIQIDPRDNVFVALQNLPKGEYVVSAGADGFPLLETIPAKHKFFIDNMQEEQPVYMYGVMVGRTRYHAQKGSLMTTDNTVHASEKYRYRGFIADWHSPDIKHFAGRTFMGYERSDGNVGTANYWIFIPTVFCENRNLDVIKEALHNELGYSVVEKYRQSVKAMLDTYKTTGQFQTTPTPIRPIDVKLNRVFPNVDGIKFLNHSGGCGGTRQDASTLSKLMAAYADHPNVSGVTVMSLGCQHFQVEQLLADIQVRNPRFDKPLYIFEQQSEQSEEALIIKAIQKTLEGLAYINTFQRKPFPLSKLTVGVKCGGSDGFSGISANPAVGYCSDLLAALDGKVLLAEFPELCGAEQGLLDRCVSEDVANRFTRLMQEYDAFAHLVGSGFHMNPSPGNIKDGLITDAIKSAGAAKKGGTSPIIDVLDYTEKATKSGLSLVCTPGNDVEATTGKAASGANLILFTTGLGTPTGNPVAPTIKLATNSALAERMKDIIDIDTGGIVRGEKTIEEMGVEILEYCIKVASGEMIPKAVLLGQDDFIPWKKGVSL